MATTLFQASNKTSPSGQPPRHKHSSMNILPKPVGPLTAFAFKPDNIEFETQDQDEIVMLFVRQHIIVLLPRILIGILMLFAPALLIPFLIRASQSIPVSIPPGYFLVGVVFWYEATFGFLLASFLHWFFNIYIVTNRRIVDIDFVHLLYKEFTEATIEKVEDITFVTSGVFAAVFNFGDVRIQTAGEQPNIEFQAVPSPEKVTDVVSDLMKERHEL